MFNANKHPIGTFFSYGLVTWTACEYEFRLLMVSGQWEVSTIYLEVFLISFSPFFFKYVLIKWVFLLLSYWVYYQTFTDCCILLYLFSDLLHSLYILWYSYVGIVLTSLTEGLLIIRISKFSDMNCFKNYFLDNHELTIKGIYQNVLYICIK